MIKKLAGIASGLLLASLVTVGLTMPAQAASSDIIVCNSGGTSGSYTYIVANPDGGNLFPGRCTALPLQNGSNQVRVDTDPTGASHSYKIKPDGGSYGPCHTNSDNHASDPPNVAKVYYRNYNHGDCTN